MKRSQNPDWKKEHHHIRRNIYHSSDKERNFEVQAFAVDSEVPICVNRSAHEKTCEGPEETVAACNEQDKAGYDFESPR
jgi:hypothetical protein